MLTSRQKSQKCKTDSRAVSESRCAIASVELSWSNDPTIRPSSRRVINTGKRDVRPCPN